MTKVQRTIQFEHDFRQKVGARTIESFPVKVEAEVTLNGAVSCAKDYTVDISLVTDENGNNLTPWLFFKEGLHEEILMELEEAAVRNAMEYFKDALEARAKTVSSDSLMNVFANIVKADVKARYGIDLNGRAAS